MKRILGIAMVVGLVGALTVMAQEVKPGKGEVKGKSGKAQVKVSPGKVEVIELGKNVNLEMVLIPAGKFMMGFTKKDLADFKVEVIELGKKSTKKELGKDTVDLIISMQGKQHEVTLTKSFYMGKYEVTQEQWVEIMGEGENPSGTKGAKLPVTSVSWEKSQEFIKKLNAKTSGGYRLPTEAEWEYSCRAGTTTAYSFGDKITPKDANYAAKIGKPVAVGSYKPNAFGLYDMHGNVWERCEDWHGEYPLIGFETGAGCVLRGGSFIFHESIARSSYRYIIFSPTNRLAVFNGLRLARTP